jgi:multiple sugar transport system substrate-binding protein
MNKQDLNNVSRRDFLKVVVLGEAATALAGCVPAVATESAAATESAVAEIQFWDMVWGPPEYIDSAKKLVEKFNQSQSAIKVTYQSISWDSFPQAFTTAIGSGTAPDASSGGGYQPIQFYPDGGILDIDDLAAKFDAGLFFPGTLDTMKYNGHTIAIPWAVDLRIPYYRKDLFEAADASIPTNFDELRAALKKLTSGDKYGIAFSGSTGSAGWQQLMALMINNGGGLFDETGKLDVLNERNVEALMFVQDMMKEGLVHPGSAGFNDADMLKAFSNGSVAMVIYVPGTEDQVPEVKDKVMMLSPMTGPHGDTGTLAYTNPFMIYKQTMHPEEAKTFLKWWSENLLPVWTEGHCGQLPASTKIAADPYFQSNANTQRIFEEWVPVGKTPAARASGMFPLLAEIDAGSEMATLATDILQGNDVVESLTKLETSIKAMKTYQE